MSTPGTRRGRREAVAPHQKTTEPVTWARWRSQGKEIVPGPDCAMMMHAALSGPTTSGPLKPVLRTGGCVDGEVVMDAGVPVLKGDGEGRPDRCAEKEHGTMEVQASEGKGLIISEWRTPSLLSSLP